MFNRTKALYRRITILLVVCEKNRVTSDPSGIIEIRDILTIRIDVLERVVRAVRVFIKSVCLFRVSFLFLGRSWPPPSFFASLMVRAVQAEAQPPAALFPVVRTVSCLLRWWFLTESLR